MTLAFASLNNDASVPALDGVRITAVPEPSLVKVFGVGAAAFALVEWRSRSSSNKRSGSYRTNRKKPVPEPTGTVVEARPSPRIVGS